MSDQTGEYPLPLDSSGSLFPRRFAELISLSSSHTHSPPRVPLPGRNTVTVRRLAHSYSPTSTSQIPLSLSYWVLWGREREKERGAQTAIPSRRKETSDSVVCWIVATDHSWRVDRINRGHPRNSKTVHGHIVPRISWARTIFQAICLGPAEPLNSDRSLFEPGVDRPTAG